MIAPLDPSVYRDIVQRAIDEDVGSGDITTGATVSRGQRARGVFLVNGDCVIAGLDVVSEVFRQVAEKGSAPRPVTMARKLDGDACRTGEVVAEVTGSAAVLLTAERTALNFLQRLSGIATLARAFVDAAGGHITVLDTRKTTPTLRALDKYAVRAGGATNHRAGLFDAVLIKDNHIRLAGGIEAAIGLVRLAHPELPIEVEAQTLAEVDEALSARADIILFDNLSLDDIREAVRRVRGNARTEISGGVTLERMRDLAATGADFVSAGALTHSAPSVDISFELEPI